MFGNFTHLFQFESFTAGEEDEQADKLMCADEFYGRYFEFKIGNLNQ